MNEFETPEAARVGGQPQRTPAPWRDVGRLALSGFAVLAITAALFESVNRAFYRRHFQRRDMALETTVSGPAVDWLIVGTSHAIALRDFGLAAEGTVLNVADSDLGVIPAVIKLSYVMQRYDVRNILFVFDPFQVAARRNEYAKAFDFHRYDPRLAALMREYGLSTISRVRHRFGMVGNLPQILYWYLAGTHVVFDPVAAMHEPPVLQRFRDWEDRGGKARARIGALYVDVNTDTARLYLERFGRFCDAVAANGTRIVVLMPPYPATTLTALPPSHTSIADLMGNIADAHGLTMVDATHGLPDETLYADTDHLNTRGVAALRALFDDKTARGRK